MSSFAAHNAHYVISFASAVAYMRATTAAKRLTSVDVTADSALIISSPVVHRMSLYFRRQLLAEKTTVLDTPASTCT